jgi:hypothetical protein
VPLKSYNPHQESPFPGGSPHLPSSTPDSTPSTRAPTPVDSPYQRLLNAQEQLRHYVCTHSSDDDLTNAMADIIHRSMNFDMSKSSLNRLHQDTNGLLSGFNLALGELERLVGCSMGERGYQVAIQKGIQAQVHTVRMYVARMDQYMKVNVGSDARQAADDRDSLVELTGLMAKRIEFLESRMAAAQEFLAAVYQA